MKRYRVRITNFPTRNEHRWMNHTWVNDINDCYALRNEKEAESTKSIYVYTVEEYFGRV